VSSKNNFGYSLTDTAKKNCGLNCLENEKFVSQDGEISRGRLSQTRETDSKRNGATLENYTTYVVGCP
jgi:hypothetical protein